jgi:hypothetical protein
MINWILKLVENHPKTWGHGWPKTGPRGPLSPCVLNHNVPSAYAVFRLAIYIYTHTYKTLFITLGVHHLTSWPSPPVPNRASGCTLARACLHILMTPRWPTDAPTPRKPACSRLSQCMTQPFYYRASVIPHAIVLSHSLCYHVQPFLVL